VVAPNVSLVSPANASTWSSSSTITFSYNVTDDNNIKNCSLVINNATDQSDTTISKNTTQSFVKTLSNSNYNWSVFCYDTLNNQGNSTIYILTVSYTAPSDSGSSGGGGGGGGGGAVATNISNNLRTKTWFKVFRGKEIDWSVNNFVIKYLKAIVKNDTSNAKITIVLFDKHEKPKEVTELENIYKYMRITTRNLEVENVKIEFKVDKQWLVNYDKDSVVLSKFKEKWINLPTKYLGEIINFSYYESQSDSFSYFAIRARQKEEEITKEVFKNATKEEVKEPQEFREEVVFPPKELIEKKERKRTVIGWLIIFFIIFIGLICYILCMKKFKQKGRNRETDSLQLLEDYINVQLSKGRTTKQIKNSLSKVGWPSKLVEEIMRKMK
jgi:PGF-pre-PGF domain-containing protein